MTSDTPLDDLVVILDLDGTLVDSAPDLTAAMNVVLRNSGFAELPGSDFRHLVGHGARALLINAFAHHGQADIPSEKMDVLVEEFLEYYRGHFADHSELFPNCHNTMHQLKTHGAKLAICTNKTEALTYPLIDHFEITPLFDAIICRDTLPVYKPDPAPLIECMLRSKVQHGVMVGDTDTDLNAAIAAQLPCFIASFGYGVFSDEQNKKALQFNDFAELPGLILNEFVNFA